jgi:hypothetical protein
MNDKTIDLDPTDEQALVSEVSDEALEAAANTSEAYSWSACIQSYCWACH